MRQDSRHIEALEELKLGRLEMLKSDQFELTQQVFYRAQKPCGVLFCLHGPRALRLTAIWDADQNRILFYGSCGQRVHSMTLERAPFVTQSRLAWDELFANFAASRGGSLKGHRH
jgi:hypothetical protein